MRGCVLNIAGFTRMVCEEARNSYLIIFLCLWIFCMRVIPSQFLIIFSLCKVIYGEEHYQTPFKNQDNVQ